MTNVFVIVRPMSADEAAARERVVAERRRRGWSQRRAAVAAGVSNTYWNDYESGKVPVDGIRNPIRQAVADAFGWPLDWPESAPVPQQQSSATVRQVAEDAVSEVLKTMTDGKADIIEAVTVLGGLHEQHAVQLHAINIKLDAILATMGISLPPNPPAKKVDDGTRTRRSTSQPKRRSAPAP